MRSLTPWLILCISMMLIAQSYANVYGADPEPILICEDDELMRWWNTAEYAMDIDTPPPERRLYRQLKTNEYMYTKRVRESNNKKPQADLERWINHMAIRKPQKEEVTIPIVFHVLHSNDKSRITEEQILSQIEVLNQDFSSHRTELSHPSVVRERFFDRVGYANIRFCVAMTERGSKGITYQEVKEGNWTYDDRIKSGGTGGADPWDASRYLNVWIGTLADSVSGYAQMPGHAKATDGIVIDHRYFGTTGTATYPYDGGRTLTHLVANYLGVYPLWGLVRCADDKVRDTPVHNGPNFGCPGGNHVSVCTDQPVEMLPNFMDNTDDRCMSFFTAGQISRMYAVVAKDGPRGELSRSGSSLCDQDTEPDSLDGKDLEIPTVSIFQESSKRILVVESKYLSQKEVHVDILNHQGESVIRKKTLAANTSTQFDFSKHYPGAYYLKYSLATQTHLKKVILR